MTAPQAETMRAASGSLVALSARDCGTAVVLPGGVGAVEPGPDAAVVGGLSMPGKRGFAAALHSMIAGLVPWLMVVAVSVVHADVGDNPAQQSVNRETLQAKLDETEAAPDLDEETRGLLSDLYLQSISNLEAHADQREATRGYAASIASDPATSEALSKETRRLEGSPYRPQLGFDRTTDTTDIAQQLLKVRANLSVVETDVRHMQMTLEHEQRRLTEARQQLSRANSSQSEQPDAIDKTDQGAETPTIKQARIWLRETTDQALGSQIKMLDQELLSHTPRVELLKAQIARREVTIEHLRQDVAAIESVLGERRQVEADEAIALAQKAQFEAEGKDPLLIRVATDNASTSSRLLSLANEIESESARASEVEAQAQELEENFRIVRQKLEVAGVNRALGRILQDQRAALPKQRTIKAQLKSKEALISDITLDQLVIDEQLKALRRLDEVAEEMLAKDRKGRASRLETAPPPARLADTSSASGAGADEGERAVVDGNAAAIDDAAIDGDDEPEVIEMSDEEVLDELKKLLRQRADLLVKLAAINSSYLQALSDLEFAQRRLVEVVKDFDSYLSERLLWVRSVAYPTFDGMDTFSGDVLHHLAIAEWRYVWRKLIKVNSFSPLLILGLLTALILIRQRAHLRKRLLLCNRYLGNPVKDRFSATLQSLGLSILLCVPGPLILISFCVKLAGTGDQSALHQALIGALLWLSMNWFFFLVFYQICCAEGLGHRHFRWHVPALRPLRQEVFLLMIVYLPVGFITVISIDLDSSAMEWTGVRLLLIISMLTFAGFFLRVLRRNGRVMQSLIYSKSGVMLVRLRWLWMGLSVIIPMLLVGLTIIGYVYTAYQLMNSFTMSFWVVILLVLVHQLCVRWLNMTATKLHYQALQDGHKKQLQESIDAGGNGIDQHSLTTDEPLLNLALLGRDSLKLVNILTGILAVLGFLVVWSELLPALGYLNNIQLWDSLTSVDGETVLKPITLADFGLSVLLVSITLFLYRTLPSLQELFLLQVLNMPTANRYTVITLTRYLLLTCSVFYIASLLGFEWAKIQWLVAALGVGIGFGLQEIVANFISGLIILFERPIRVGDRVTVGTIEGNVSRIRARATTIQTWDRQELLVPNKEFITGTLLNWSLSDQVSRLVVNVGMAYGSNVHLALAIVAGVAEEDEKVLAEPAPLVTLESFGDNTLNICLRCFLDDMEVRLSTNSRLNVAINRAFDEAGIVIAFPQVDVHFDEKQPLHIRLQRDLAAKALGPKSPGS
jgi:potassium efflux system protein